MPAGLDPLERLLAFALLLTASLIGVHLVPGALGLLTVGFVLATTLLVCAAAWFARRTVERPDPVAPAAESRWSWAIAAGAAVLTAGCGLMLARDLAGAPITSIDALNFQVPIPARWLQGDSVWGLHQFTPDYSNATYPLHANLLVASVMLPFDSAFLTRLVAVPYWALAAVAILAAARELGAPRSAALLAGTAFAAMPVVTRTGLEGVQTDMPMIACLSAGVLFLLRHHRTGARSDLLLAGVGLGLAFGTKWYAVTTVAALLGLWALARAVGGRQWLRPALGLVGLVGAIGGFWFLRNLIETGNPVFPQALGPFDAPPDPLREASGFTVADYLFDGDVWDGYLLPAFESTFAPLGALLLAGAILAAVLRPRGPVLVVVIGAAVLLAIYLVTPYSAFGPEDQPVHAAASTRYALPALVAATMAGAWALGRLGRARIAVEAVVALALLDALRRGFESLSGAKVLGGALVVGALALVLRWLLPRRGALLIAAGIGVVLAVVAVEATRDRANRTGYGRFDPTLAWIESNAPDGTRIGLAGVWSTDFVSPVLPAFGPRLGNDVEYVGPFREHLLRRYATAADFTSALADFDLLVVGRAMAPREERWAIAAGWEPVAESQRLALLRAPLSSPD